ncbi:TPA: DUF2478 domain-containing protein [Stenotrophomonas maltophilia]|uniref:DUF2478 domain-containing protein n=1 Tax=Stenotrophomonas maltophilia TaxID=40324 RepID=UPI002A92C2C9|nr:DUF2478 domain-containing protein [Stenotrophomonas maltophilia]HEL5404082.1 DUF2478 domain-containing protein [Stenotrophomonas maltophilia]
MTASSPPRIAAIVHDHSGEPDGLLAAFAARQLAAGHRVRGLVHLPHETSANGSKRMALMDVTDPGSRYPISQALGPASCGCNLDPGGIADATAVLRRALQERAELAIANRFGTLESEGGGMVDELLALMLADIPLLTAVKLPYLDAWRQFTGGMAIELPAEDAALQAWWDACRTAPDAAA